MSKNSAPAQAGGADIQNLAFEEAMKKLESIVQAMESQDLPLEQMLSRYEEGTRLALLCQAKLAEAEVKIQQIEKNSKGEMAVKPVSVQ